MTDQPSRIMQSVPEMKYYDGTNLTPGNLVGGEQIDNITGGGFNRATFSATNNSQVDDNAVAVLVCWGMDALIGSSDNPSSFSATIRIGHPTDVTLQQVYSSNFDGWNRHTHSGGVATGVSQDNDSALWQTRDSMWIALSNQEFDYSSSLTDTGNHVDSIEFEIGIRAELVKQ